MVHKRATRRCGAEKYVRIRRYAHSPTPERVAHVAICSVECEQPRFRLGLNVRFRRLLSPRSLPRCQIPFSVSVAAMLEARVPSVPIA